MKKLSLMFIWYIICLFVHTNEIGYFAESCRIGENAISETGKTYLLYYNPAGLYDIVVPEIMVNYGILYPDLTDGTKFYNNTLCYVHNNLLKGGIGCGINQFSVENWYEKYTILIGYGRKVNPRLKLGVKLTFLYESYKLGNETELRDNPVFRNYTEKLHIPSLSLGSQYDTKVHNFALVIDNINQPNIGFYTSDILPIELKFGYRYIYKDLKLLVSMKRKFAVKPDYTLGAGIEYNFLINKWLKLTPSAGINFGSRDYNMFSTGFSLHTAQINFSCSYTTSLVAKVNTGGDYKFSLGYKLSPVPVVEEKVDKIEYDRLLSEKEALAKQIVALREKIKILERKTPEKVPPERIQEKVIVSTPPVTEPSPVVEDTMEILLKKLYEMEKKLKEVEKPPTEPPTTTIERKPAVTPTTVPPTPKKRYHTVVPGDTLPKLAEKYYGDAAKWKIIYDANRDKITRGQLVPNTVLEIP